VGNVSALFIGGNGIISSACSRLAVERGIDLTLLNRGIDATRPPIEGARTIIADATDHASLRTAVGDREFDVVVNFRGFVADDIVEQVNIFKGRTGQYVFISSAAAYHKPVRRLPITESTPLRNAFWQYARDKIACERVLTDAYRDDDFPVTIVRPSHTYDKTLIPLDGGWTVIDRMRRGKRTVIYGDGTSLWTLTHQRDFALGFTGLLGNPAAIGDTFQITSDEALTWDAIAQCLAAAAGTTAEILHVSSTAIAAALPDWGPGVLGDKAHSVVFDNSKVKSVVPEYKATIPFWRGAREIIDWYDEDESRRVVDPAVDDALDRLVGAHEATGFYPRTGNTLPTKETSA
jgi:nucleoside-diphosphate-sugar epimerase